MSISIPASDAISAEKTSHAFPANAFSQQSSTEAESADSPTEAAWPDLSEEATDQEFAEDTDDVEFTEDVDEDEFADDADQDGFEEDANEYEYSEDATEHDFSEEEMSDDDYYESDTPTVDTFLEEMSELLVNKSADEIESYFQLEPPFNDTYQAMIQELNESFPFDTEDALEDYVEEITVFQEWPAFSGLLVEYLCYLRDIDLDYILEAYLNLEDLVRAVNDAFAHPSDGSVLLPTVVKFSRMLGMLSTRLSRSGEDLQQLRQASNAEGEEDKARESLPERTSNVIKAALTACLNERAASLESIEGKKSAIYKLANASLKVLFRGKESANAEQIFSKITAQSPPLALYPKSERVTYLYYLGLYHYINSHYLLCIKCMNEAYSTCHPESLKQRRLILLPLVASNVIMGRFPSQTLLSRPEAVGLADAYLPVCRTIVKGDLLTFRRLMDPSNSVAQALQRFNAYYEIQHKCQVLIWRSLARRLLLMTASQPVTEDSVPTFSIKDFCTLIQAMERRALIELKPTGKVDAKGDPVLYSYVQPEFIGTKYAAEAKAPLPSIWEVESICTSLIDQGLLNAYVSHKQLRCAIQGAKKIGPVEAGFPNAFQALSTNIADDGEDNEQEEETDEVPGWKLQPDPDAGPSAGVGPGMVINLSGVKAIGEA